MLVPEGEAAWDSLDSELGVLSLLFLPPSLGATRTAFFDIAGNKAIGRFQTTANVIEFTLRKLDRTTPHSAISGLSNAATAKPTGLLPRTVVLKVSEHLLKDA